MILSRCLGDKRAHSLGDLGVKDPSPAFLTDHLIILPLSRGMGMDPILPNNPMRPAAAATCPAAGNWRLDRLPKSQTVFLALALSLGVHTAFLLAFNRHAPRAIWVPIPVVPPTGDPMPPEPDEPPPPSTEVIDLKEPPPVNVPRLPDAPSRIDLHSDFVEPLQLPPPLTELTRDKLSKIPTNIPSDRRRPAENIFELKDLGRAPRAIAQSSVRRVPATMVSSMSNGCSWLSVALAWVAPWITCVKPVSGKANERTSPARSSIAG